MVSDTLLATGCGLFVGILFTALKLPIPAPPVLPGVMGIVGVYLGSLIYHEVIKWFT